MGIGKKRAQASLEYMVILALSLGIFSAILYVTTTMITSASSQIGIDSAYRAAQDIKESSDFIYIHGHPSKTRLNLYIPPNVESISINESVINLRIAIGDAYTDVYSVAMGNITANLSGITHEGYYLLNVESTGGGTINVTLV